MITEWGKHISFFSGTILLLWTICVGAETAADSSTTGPTDSVAMALDTVKIVFGDTLSGNLPAALPEAKGPYIVVSDLLVPQGKTVIIEGGTTLLFANFTGIKVQGTLLARGSKEKPITFTSINDKEYNPLSKLKPAPYDWNGIHIYEDGIGSNLTHCNIFYSVYGIMSMTRYIRLGDCQFAQNGRSNLSIEGKEHEVGTEPYSYALTVQDVSSSGVPLAILKDPMAFRRNAFRYTGIALGAGGFVTGIIFTARYGNSASRFNDLSSTDPANLASNTSADWKSSRSRTRKDMALMVLGYLGAAIGSIGLTYSFTF